MFNRVLVVCAALALGSCGPITSDADVYTLYRTSLAGSELVQVATFDASEGRDYNETNCGIVADLMRSQPGVIVRYMCTQGRHRN